MNRIGRQAIDTAVPFRPRFSLDGAWDFRFEGDPEGLWRSIEVPGTWNAAFKDLRWAVGEGWYRRQFQIPADWAGRQLALRFGAVNYATEIWLNGKPLGAHEGGYLPFEVDIDPALLIDANELQVRVILPCGDERRYPDYPFQATPHGKQSWYGPAGGIWQPVFLEARDPRHIQRCELIADRATGTIAIKTNITKASHGLTLRATIYGPDARIEARAEAGVTSWSASLSVAVPQAQDWSPASPALYTVTLELIDAGVVVDRWSETTGFRSIETRDGRFFLNGAPLYLRGALDQDYHAISGYALASPVDIEARMRAAKRLGFNCLRVHLKAPDPRYYAIADRVGMLIWSELPNFAEFSDAAIARAIDTLEGIVARDGHHPSIIIWTILNEDWGPDIEENPDHRTWLVEVFDHLKQLDPTRLVVDNSPCFPNFHVKTDINDFHYYRAIPDRRAEWDWLTEQFAARAPWTFAPDGQPTGQEPLVVSEFGVWGLPRLNGRKGPEPWWFEMGEEFGDGTAHPQGIERRYRLLALDRVFVTLDAFIEATQQQQFEGLKYQIESIRSRKPIQGYVVTELTDTYWEANGLIDMDGRPRAFAKAFAQLNAAVCLIPRPKSWACWSGQPLEIAIAIATGEISLSSGGKLEWRFDDTVGCLPVPPIDACQAVALPPIELSTPIVEAAVIKRVEFILRDPAGLEIARSHVSFSLYPRRNSPKSLTIWPAHDDIAAYLQGLGYQVLADKTLADVCIVRTIDSADANAIRQGARYLVLADGPGDNEWLRTDQDVPGSTPILPAAARPMFPRVIRRSREIATWRGDWISTFGWIERSGAFAALPGGPLLDLSFERVVPRHVLWGVFSPWEMQAGRVPAGIVVGWVHRPAAYVVQRPFGAGRLVATTFRLMEDTPGLDPVAVTLLDALIQTARNDSRIEDRAGHDGNAPS